MLEVLVKKPGEKRAVKAIAEKRANGNYDLFFSGKRPMYNMNPSEFEKFEIKGEHVEPTISE